MSFITDLIAGIVAQFNKSSTSPAVPTTAPSQQGQTTTPSPAESAGTKTGPLPAALPPDREGTFLIPDVFPGDLGPNPPFHVLPGLKVGNKEIIGCYVKATEGLGWGATNEAWFQRAWKALGTLQNPEFGRGCYHFLRFDTDGAKQADYFCDQIEKAGGWLDWDFAGWVDAEEGGQGHWADDPKTHTARKLEKITDTGERARLSGEVRKCLTDFIARFKQRTGKNIGVYGRGIFRDLHMTNCRFGEDMYCDPAYTAEMPTMEQYGVSIDHITEWQISGDGQVFRPGYPSMLPGWGATDYSVYIDGVNKTTLYSLWRRALAKPRS